MQRKDLALRVLSTAAIMSIVTSIAAPAFAGTYYLGEFTDNVFKVEVDTNGTVKVNGVEDTTDVVIRGGTAADYAAPAPATGNSEDGSAPAATAAAGTEDSAAGEGTPPATGNSEGGSTATASAGTEDSAAGEGTPPATGNAEDGSAPAAATPTATTPAAAAPTATLADAAPTAAPTTTTPAAGSVTTPTTSVIKVINNWVNHVLNIRLDNVNIKSTTDAAMTVSGDGGTKIELDGKNTLDSSNVSGKAGLNKQGNGIMTITDEKTDGGETRTSKAANDETGSLTVVGGNYAAGIGGNHAGSLNGSGDTKNITIEGYATVDATSGKNSDTGIYGGAGIGGGNFGSADNIIIQGNANVTAKTGYHSDGAAIGGGTAGSGTNIGIYDHATVKATASMMSAAIGRGSYGQKASVTIGREGKTQENENVHVTATAYISAIGGMAGYTGTAADQTTDIVIQGGATIEEARGVYGAAIGGDSGDSSVSNIIIRGHAVIKKAGLIGGSYRGSKTGEKTTVSIEDHARLEDVKVIGGQDVEEVNVTVKDNAYVGTVQAIGEYNDDSSKKIGKLTAKILDNATIEKLSGWIGKRPYSSVDESEVIVDGGKNGKVTVKATDGNGSAYINANTVQIKNNVLLKLKQSSSTYEPNYIAANGVEMTRDDLMRTIGDDAEIWYTDKDNHLQKIVHGKNLCTKHETDHQDATCTEKGWKEYGCTLESNNHAAAPTHTDRWKEYIPATGHHWKDNGEANHICVKGDATKAHSYGEWVVDTPATCTTAGQKKRTCTECGHVETQEIPATGHHWVDKGDGTHTCPDCGATEALPVNTNSALELRVVDAEGMNEPFTVSQNGTLRTYTGAYDIATLTGDLDTLRYLQEHGAQTIQFVTNGQTSSFDINDLLAQGSGSEVFYLAHRGAEEPTLLLVEADHSELVKD